MSSENSLDRFRASYVGPEAWQRSVSIARVAVLLFAAGGVALTRRDAPPGLVFQAVFVVALCSSLWSIVSLWSGLQGRRFKWWQMALDFTVVALTILSTNGSESNFTFLFVIVILEVGLLLGMPQGFVFATLSTIFMLLSSVWTGPGPEVEAAASAEHWYNFLIQGLAYYLTAFISGYWNQRLRGMQQFQREILNNMSSGFLISDRHGIVSGINRAAGDILNVREEEAVGRPVEEIVRVSTYGECPILATYRSGRDFSSYEFHALVGNGMKLLGLTTNRIFGPDKELTGIISTFTDLTEMDRLRQDLRRQDRMAVLGELSTGLAHEIRNPVAAIRGSLEELDQSRSSPQTMQKLAQIAVREADHLNEIITGFLDFARNPIIRRERIDLHPLIREIGALLQREYQDSEGIRIQLELAEDPCAVPGDRSQLKQVFMNLAKNGVESMAGNGTLTIRLLDGANTCEVRFEDEGEGIDPDKLSRIFEPFYTTKNTGVGMGLSVCLRILTAHDATLHPEPREGGGTVMTVRLPRADTNWEGNANE